MNDLEQNDGSIIRDINVKEGDVTKCNMNYNDEGRLASILYPSGDYIKYKYNEKGLVKYKEMSNKGSIKWIKCVFDKNSNVLREESSTGKVILFKYDEKGKLIDCQCSN